MAKNVEQKTPVSQLPARFQTKGKIIETKRYRWNMSDGPTPLIGYVCDVQLLKGTDPGEVYKGVIIFTTEPTHGKADGGEVEDIPAGKFVIMSESAGLQAAMSKLEALARNPTHVCEVAIVREKSLKTTNGNMWKCTVVEIEDPKARAELPSVPQYGVNVLDDSFDPARLGAPTNGTPAQLPGAYE